ncbi:response regulator [Microvirga sp. 3-52]|uniref:response regulator n=1 Tax=Microvirga sp. 3-52 TaxID=2792425 RepID=UPI001ACD5616|nr:response regulator [Microvirga sp. 3-52]MBO1909166.1 response regulator [Microvirga sp. 3-52]MBS7454582.1 response regulator [Microvirga sp. 3-52]
MSEYPQNRCLVLLVEDEALVAMNLQDDLKEAGYAVVGPFDTCAAALAWLERETPDLAVLDTVLKDGTCRDLAAELARRGVGFVLWSGHLQDKQALKEFTDAVWVEKPSTHTALLHALAGLRILPNRRQA